ncbi:DUF4168 domain-containing protein [Eoetvoesiella caeni]|uniref:Uncharacterized protein DUF4168 n=1 Tax=Eoetvoesiella caeni TaxID=645616 RepID=A0A366HEI7_9BURK|nr:DUF4168 domain-containing protein [Eoetvoesiella caeni]MCI2808574.1 DUF4168 domain-containing protein [Eoetvoesiella caeni]NYT55114.1 DUF4168 domain-containing protein [Eoetvoesiella caeni]RBP40906.1 uncharacterized protein DUF4168 [Eoetvoesiella caeni]
MHKRLSIIFSTGLLAFGLSSGTVMAQQASPPNSMAAPAANYTDAQLNKFISASRKVAVISQEYTPKLETTNDEASKTKVIKEADDKMVQAIHEEGMTVDQFNGLNQAAQQDPKLLQRLQSMANK